MNSNEETKFTNLLEKKNEIKRKEEISDTPQI